MKKIFCFFTILLLAACQNQSKPVTASADQNSGFENYRENFVSYLWRLYPGWASSIGFHNYDSVLTVPNSSFHEEEFNFANAQLDSLNKFDSDALSDNNKTDLLMIRDFMNSTIWGLKSLKSFEWDPSTYNVCGAFAEILNNDYDSLDIRLNNFYLKMTNIKAFYEAAKQNIHHPTIEHAELAILQNSGGLSVFESDLTDALKRSKLSINEQEKIQTRAKESVLVIKDYVTWLKELDNAQPRSFRLGKDLYSKKFELDIQSGYTADQVFEKAITHKKELHDKMFTITESLWSKYMKNKMMPAEKLVAIKQLIDIISLKHVQPDSFQTAIEQQIPALTAFIKKKNLIDLDPTKPLVVRKEPAYMAGLAGASISSPGPYDKNGNTYYNVGSLSGWSKERSESYLREYNYYILQILNIHEAIPGHYIQLVYSNKSPSIIKSILGNGAMIEGWAVYTERMMLENGYGATGTSTEADPEMWLMYYKWNLRSTCNMILDYSVHTKEMTKESALSLLTNEAFQQQAEAEGKWKRVTLSQVQLCSYFTGYTEIYDFREAYKKLKSDDFNLKEFHEKFLSYGSAPVKYIKELMLKEIEK